jgi:uncharacterized membrane protein YkvA (DUF1232 family)
MLLTSFRYHGPWTSGDPEHSFSASDLRTFGFTDVPPVEPPAGTRFTLQGPRDPRRRDVTAERAGRRHGMRRDMQSFAHARYFDDGSFWRTVRRAARRAGRELVEEAITLYHCLRDPDTPAWARAVIVGALGYFILPTDLIPDFVPGVGFTDDFGAFVLATTCVALHVKQDHRNRARRMMSLFG